MIDAKPIIRLYFAKIKEVFYDLSQEEQMDFMRKDRENLDKLGMKAIKMIDCRWSNEEWDYIGVEEWPNIEALEERGKFEKGELKTFIKDTTAELHPALFDDQPLPGGFLFDSDVAFTDLTKDLLNSSCQEARTWSDSDNNIYKLDRNRVLAVLTQMDAQATQINLVAIALFASAQAADISAKVFEIIGKVYKVSDGIAKTLEVVKYFANAGTVVVPAVYVYKLAPDQMAQGVAEAYGGAVVAPASTASCPL